MRTVATRGAFFPVRRWPSESTEKSSARGFRREILRPGGQSPMSSARDGEGASNPMDERASRCRLLSKCRPPPTLCPAPTASPARSRLSTITWPEAVRAPSRPALPDCRMPMQSPDARSGRAQSRREELGFVGAMVHGTSEGRFLDDARYDGPARRRHRACTCRSTTFIPHLPPEPGASPNYSNLPDRRPGASSKLAGWGWPFGDGRSPLRMCSPDTP